MNSEQNKKILCILLAVVVGLSFGYKIYKSKKSFDKVNKQKEEIHNMWYDNDLSGVEFEVIKSEKITENLPKFLKDDEVYVKVYLKITNNSNEPFEFSSVRCYVIDDSDERIHMRFAESGVLNSNTIDVGESLEGFVSFVINKENNIKKFMYYKGASSKVPAFEDDINY